MVPKFLHCVTAQLHHEDRAVVVLAAYCDIKDAIEAARQASNIRWIRNVGIQTTALDPDLDVTYWMDPDAE